jgi:Pyruvate/2-oxoacid:ferredoxin oxidoreductase delta subunit
MGMPNKPLRIRDPRIAAVVNQDGCTGCEACLTVCPVDSIEPVPGGDHPGLLKLVEIDLDRCIGCGLCPKICPWDTITMEKYPAAKEIAPPVTIRSIVPGHTARTAET